MKKKLSDVPPQSFIEPGNDSRRDFLRKTAIAGMAAAMVPVLPVSAKTPGMIPDALVNSRFPGGKGTITFLITSDIHAQLHTHDEFFWINNQAVYRKRGGLAVLKTMIDHYRKQNPEFTVLYDGGDYFHGSAVASLTEGVALIEVFNHMGYDLILPGNWEVVYKKKQMLYDMGHSNAAKVCANMFHKSDTMPGCEPVYPPYWIRYIGGVKIGVIGYTDHLIPKRQSPAYSEGLTFEHADKSIQKYVKLLRETEGCTVVMLATHMGLAQQVGLANNPVCKGVDLIIGADTHERVREPIQCKYTNVIECGAFGSFLGKLDLLFENGNLKGMNYQLLDVDPDVFPPDPETAAIVEKIYAPYREEITKVIGTSSTPLVRYFVLESPMDNMITDAIKWKIKTDIALSNGFRFCQPLNTDPKTGIASITKEFLWNMLPVNSEVKTAVVTGRQVIDWLEQELQNAFAPNPANRFGGWFVRYCGMEVNYTIGNEFGHRVNSVRVGGKPIDPAHEYTIAACEREGDPDDTLCRMEKVKSPKRTGLFMHEVIEAYLAGHSPVKPKIEGRATATDAQPTLLTQLQGTTYEFR